MTTGPDEEVCPACQELIPDGDGVPVENEAGERVDIHGSCLLKRYPAAALDEDKEREVGL